MFLHNLLDFALMKYDTLDISKTFILTQYVPLLGKSFLFPLMFLFRCLNWRITSLIKINWPVSY